MIAGVFGLMDGLKMVGYWFDGGLIRAEGTCWREGFNETCGTSGTDGTGGTTGIGGVAWNESKGAANGWCLNGGNMRTPVFMMGKSFLV